MKALLILTLIAFIFISYTNAEVTATIIVNGKEIPAEIHLNFIASGGKNRWLQNLVFFLLRIRLEIFIHFIPLYHLNCNKTNVYKLFHKRKSFWNIKKIEKRPWKIKFLWFCHSLVIQNSLFCGSNYHEE